MSKSAMIAKTVIVVSVAEWLPTSTWKYSVPGLSLVTSYVQR